MSFPIGLVAHESPAPARGSVALSDGAGYFKLAGLPCQGFGNVIGGECVVQFHKTSSGPRKGTVGWEWSLPSCKEHSHAS